MFKEKIATISADINYVNEEPEPEPTLEEVERTTRGMKDRKSPGCDGIPAELIQAGGDAVTRIYCSLCVSILRSGRWPIS